MLWWCSYLSFGIFIRLQPLTSTILSAICKLDYSYHEFSNKRAHSNWFEYLQYRCHLYLTPFPNKINISYLNVNKDSEGCFNSLWPGSAAGKKAKNGVKQQKKNNERWTGERGKGGGKYRNKDGLKKKGIEKQLVVKLLTWSLPSFAAQPSEVMSRTIRPSSLGKNLRNNTNLNMHWRN